jgi:hypothetical protein
MAHTGSQTEDVSRSKVSSNKMVEEKQQKLFFEEEL